MSDVPAPPPGFTVDAQAGAPPPPPGFKLDQPSAPPAAAPAGVAPQPNAAAEAAKNVGSAVVRPLAKGVMALPLMAMDAGVAARNVIGDAGRKALHMQPTPDYELPSQMFEESLDSVTRKPKSVVGRAAEDVTSMLVAPQSAEEKAAAEAGKIFATPAKTKAINEAHAAGFTLPPSETGHTVGKVAQSLAGKAATEREASVKNVESAERLAKAELGLHPDAPLDDATFAALRAHEDSAYSEVANTGRITADQKYLDAVIDAGKQFTQAEKDFPGSITPDIARIKDGALQREFSARGAMDKMKLLRDDASAHLKTGKAEDRAVGMVERDLMKALRDQIQRHLESTGQSDLAARFSGAQRNLAKINAVQDSMVGVKLSPRALAKAQAKGMPLTGHLKTIADAATDFPKAFQDVQKEGEWGPYSVMDLMVGAGGAGAGTHGLPLTGAVLARPLVRKGLLSKPVQDLMSTTPPKSVTRLPGRAAAAGLAVEDLTSPDFGQQ